MDSINTALDVAITGGQLFVNPIPNSVGKPDDTKEDKGLEITYGRKDVEDYSTLVLGSDLVVPDHTHSHSYVVHISKSPKKTLGLLD